MDESCLVNTSLEDVIGRIFGAKEYYLDFLSKFVISRYLYQTTADEVSDLRMSDAEYDGYVSTLNSLLSELEDKEILTSLSEDERDEYFLTELNDYLSRNYDDDPSPDIYYILRGEERKSQIEAARENLGSSLNVVKDDSELRQERLKLLKKFHSRMIPLEDGSEIPYESGEMFQIIASMVNDDVPRSIKPLERIDPAIEWFENYENVELCESLKCDGINIRHFYYNGHWVYSCTRARSTGREKDYTDAFIKIMPFYLEHDGKPFTGIIRSEAFAELGYLPILRERYSNGEKRSFVVPRSAVISILARTLDFAEEDLNNALKVRAFNVSGISIDSLYNRFKWLESKGIPTMPHRKIVWNPECGKTITEFIKNEIKDMKDIENNCGILCDGVVVQVDSDEIGKQGVREVERDFLSSANVRGSHYNYNNIAMKFYYYGASIYRGRITKLFMERRSGNIRYAMKARIEPLYVDGGICLQECNLFNLGLVQRYGIDVGDYINIIFKNGNAAKWIYDMDELNDIIASTE